MTSIDSTPSNPIMNFYFKKSVSKKYESAVKALNTLQTNASVLQEARKRINLNNSHEVNVQNTLKYLGRVGVRVDELESRVIHITGTKGKGTTAILTEALLRSSSYRTGLFTSPHLVSVRERIRINGAPLSQEKFVQYFWPLYNKLQLSKEDENDMPAYFKFLTVMAFEVFLLENVDVAIVEVGIGGELDCTNVFTRTPVVGITSLGLDHTKLLGNTVEKIAWQKAGIMKQGSRVLTIPNHTSSAMEILRKRSLEKECSLEVVPDITDYSWDVNKFSIIQKLNASLSLQLAKAWISWNNNKRQVDYPRLAVSQAEERIISESHPSGRCQTVVRSGTTFYLDGAHTLESILVSKQWFLSTADKNSKRVLVFNTTGGRSGASLLQLLVECDFSEAIFCTNILSDQPQYLSLDLLKHGTSNQEAVSKVLENQEAWAALCPEVNSKALPSVAAALSCVPAGASVLVTGSLHLVGAVLALITPENFQQDD